MLKEWNEVIVQPGTVALPEIIDSPIDVKIDSKAALIDAMLDSQATDTRKTISVAPALKTTVEVTIVKTGRVGINPALIATSVATEHTLQTTTSNQSILRSPAMSPLLPTSQRMPTLTTAT